MNVQQILLVVASAMAMQAAPAGAFTAGSGTPFVRLAELEIDPARLDAFKASVAEEIETSIRLEPGVLTLHAVSLKDDPAQVRVFEIYKDAAAYASHLQTPHFLKFKAETQGMVRSMRLFDALPLALGAKGG